MTMWRIARVDRTPNHDPDPATYSLQIKLQDKDSGNISVQQIGVSKADLLSPNDLHLRICDNFDATFTPNDFACGAPITP